MKVSAAVAAIALVSCAGPSSNAAKLAPVAALAKPSLPAWIASISPLGKADALAQIRVIFAKPVTPVTALSGDGPRAVLDRVRIDPALRGHFTVLTPRMIGFVADQALPVGTRVRITLLAGLRDLAGDVLDRDVAWTFQTEPLALRGLPSPGAQDEETPPPAGLRPTIAVTANAAVDATSLASRASLSGGGESVPLTAVLEAQPTPQPGTNAQALFDPSLDDWVYNLRPARDLRRGTTYRLRIDPGVAPTYGNLETSRAFEGEIHTYAALEIVPTPMPSSGEEGRFAGGDPVVAFNNPLVPASIARAVTIAPSANAVKTLATVPDYRTDVIAIDPYALDQDRTYTVTIAGTVKDVFGQQLGSQRQVTIRTGAFAPGAWAPSGANVFPAGAPIALNFYATNLPGDRYQSAFARVAPTALLGGAGALAALPPYRTWPARTLSARRNEQGIVRVPIQNELGGRYGALAYGFRTALDSGDSDPANTGVVQLTNLGVFTQWFPSHGIVMVQHLSDGAPVSGAVVSVYRVDESNTLAPQQCAAGRTGANGELDLYGVDVERCSTAAASNQAPNLGVVVTEGADVATVTAWNYSGIYRYEVLGGWMTGAPLSRGTIFSDRQMYQPGELGRLTGIAYYVKGAAVVADTNARYTVTITDPSNDTTRLGSVRTDDFGVFSMPLTFSKQQPLGYYTVEAKGSNGNDINGSLRVAQFKPPNFKLSLALGTNAVPAGSSVGAHVTAAYLFGAPLQGGIAHAYVTRDVASLAPKGWDDFSFGPQWYWPEETPSFSTDVLQRDLRLDADGTGSFDVGVPRDLPFPMAYRVDVEASDVSNLSVADSQKFLALPSDAMIGLASDSVVKAGTPLVVRTIVTDAAGAPISGRAVHLELQKMNYVSATQEIEGGETAVQAIKYETVASEDVTSGDQPVTAQLVPTDAGPYRLFANFGGAPNAASNSSVQIFAFGGGEADWGSSDPNSVAVKLDKKEYAIGDFAGAMIASPYEHADVYFAVVRNDVIYRTTMRNVSGAVHVSFRVTQQMLPNAAVEAVVVRRSNETRTPENQKLSLTGMAPLAVDLSGRYLKLAVTPQQTTVHPGGAQRVAFSLTKRDGAPGQGEIVAMVVNDAILQLSDYRLPDLVATIFAQQPISTIFADNRENVTLKTLTPPLEKGFGYGGGYLAGAASTRVRANFRPMAYYGVLRTDAAGRAVADFTMPDDLTTWRVMAVALDRDGGHFATADTTFVSNQPLIANPILPQFARPGDGFDLGISVANQTGAGGALDFVLKLTGSLSFTHGDPKTERASEQISAGVQALRFPVAVGTPAPTQVEATANLGAHSDAFRVPFESSLRDSTDSVIESGTARGHITVPIALTSGGTLQVTLANTVVPQFVTPAERVMATDAFPLTDEVASRLTIASALQKLRGPYGLKLTFDPVVAGAANRAQLRSLQRGDGGFAAYSGAGASDPFATAAALNALAFAQLDGAPRDSSAVADAVAYMTRVLANPGIFAWCSGEACKTRLRFEALWALRGHGAVRTEFLSDIVARSSDFDSATQIRVARYLLGAPGWQSKGAAMADALEQRLYVTGRYAVMNLNGPGGWLGSGVQAQAQMLELLLDRHAPADRLDGAIRSLIAQRCRCGWPTTDDTAAALVALQAYAAGERLAPATVSAKVGDRTIGTARFGATASSQTFSVAADSLQGGTLAIVPTAGTVYYVVLYTYPVAANSPGELAAFRVIRTLADPSSTSSKGAALAEMDVAAALPVSVAAGRVFDIGVRAIVDHSVDRLVIDDPLPAGFEAVDTTFRTALQSIVAQSDSWQIDASQIYRDRVIAYAQHLDPGVYELHYLVRSVTPGTFAWPGARVYLQDAPEEFGRSAGTTLRVTP
ncbi:MAG: Ig-like domain-containing protein [Candidatus Eremiobacteraeota bacterium]|nr:Ig-like domain-containing protein [Candidatus Eremiobacteraeota bacterium]